MQILNSALDSSDERDYKYSKFGAVSNLPSKVLLDTNEVQNQALDGFKMGCVLFSISEASNYFNKNNTKGGDLCDISDTRSETEGDYVVNGVKLAVSEGIIAGYALVSTLEEIKQSLADGRPVHTGSQKIDWNTIKNSPYVASGTKGSGHSFHIIGYSDDEEHLICKNSYGEDRYDNGLFYIMYDNIDLLFNGRYSIIENEDSIIAYKKKIMEDIKIESAKLFVERGYTNGERPQDNITREEVWTIFERVLQKNNLT